MKKLLFLSILFLVGLIGKAQKVYFIYLESEKAIPFYIKMGDKIYSSSTAGYLILSNLKDSTYNFSIGLSGKRQIEPRFQVTVAGSDYGFLIKELDQKLNLFNLQSLELVTPLANAEVKEEGTYITRTDNFTRTLSQAVNDPSLMIEVIRKEPLKDVVKGKAAPNEAKTDIAVVKDPVSETTITADSAIVTNTIDTIAVAESQPEGHKNDSSIAVVPNVIDSTAIVKTDSVAIVMDSIARGEVVQVEETKKMVDVTDSLKKEEVTVSSKEANESAQVSSDTSVTKTIDPSEVEYKKSTIVRRSESSTTGGFGLTFIDYTVESSDTIRILIPNPKTVFKRESELKPETTERFNTIRDIEVQPQIDTTTLVDTALLQSDSGILQTDTSVAVVKLPNGCSKLATEEDFKNLQKQMSALDTDMGMINTASAVFNEKCFTVGQVKDLSALFPKAQWKYLFFEAAHKHIADAENFPSLESELKDDYYIYRFKALLAK